MGLYRIWIELYIFNNAKQSKGSLFIPHFRSLGVVPPSCYLLKPKRHTKKYIVTLKNVVAESVKNLVRAGFITPVVLSVIPFYQPIALPSFQSTWNETRNWKDALGPILEKNLFERCFTVISFSQRCKRREGKRKME